MSAPVEPPALPPLFASSAAWRDAFERRLVELLALDTLGAYILVLANATHAEALFGRLREPLQVAFGRWCDRFDRDDVRVRAAAPDDRAVFVRLRDLGLERLALTRRRVLGPWEVQFNPLRALRPPRGSVGPAAALCQPFDPGGFHFDRAFLRDEVLWEGELHRVPLRLLFNKFPFADLHALLVPEPAARRPQWLTRADHRLAWRLVASIGGRVAGVGLAYNANGANASVNHLHFQVFWRPSPLPIELARWRHMGGEADYPIPVQRQVGPDAAWRTLQTLHARGRAYNLVYRPGCVYVVARVAQGGRSQPDWTTGCAWSELAGVITTVEEGQFERLDRRAIEEGLRGLTPTP